MQRTQNGAIRALIDIATGLFIASFAEAFIFSNTEIGSLMGFGLKLFVIVSSVLLLNKMNRWSLLYLLGYLAGYFFMGKLVAFDLTDYLVISMGAVLALTKIGRKVGNEL